MEWFQARCPRCGLHLQIFWDNHNLVCDCGYYEEISPEIVNAMDEDAKKAQRLKEVLARQY